MMRPYDAYYTHLDAACLNVTHEGRIIQHLIIAELKHNSMYSTES